MDMLPAFGSVHVPPEIFDEILLWIGIKYTSDLCVVHRSWLQPCRRHLFRKLHITLWIWNQDADKPRGKEREYREILAFFRATPSVCASIRTLVLRAPPISPQNRDVDLTSAIEYCRAKIFEEIISLLPYLSDLSLHETLAHESNDDTDTKVSHPGSFVLNTMLIQHAGLPRLSGAFMSNGIHTTLSMFSKIGHLKISGLDISLPSAVARGLSNIAIQHLELEDTAALDTFLKLFSKSTNIRDLHSLVIGPNSLDDRSFSSLKEYIHLVGPHLQYLKVDLTDLLSVSYGQKALSVNLDLGLSSRMQRLRRLTLSITLYHSAAGVKSSFSCIADLLETIRPLKLLDDVTLRVDVYRTTVFFWEHMQAPRLERLFLEMPWVHFTIVNHRPLEGWQYATACQFRELDRAGRVSFENSPNARTSSTERVKVKPGSLLILP